MTWGQLRFQLKESAPDVSLDLLDGYLNGRYEQVLKASDWSGIKSHATIATMAAYQSGADTCGLTVGLATVSGVGTAWTAARIGQRFYRPGDSALYTVAAVGGVTGLTLDRAYEGNTSDAAGKVYAGSAYVFMQNVYTLPADCSAVLSILGSSSDLPLTQFSKAGLDAAAGTRTLVADPESYAVYDDSAEATPPVLHQVELYPPPLYARGLTLSYIRGAVYFDGQSTNSGPLPWVSSTTLLYGCRADIAMEAEKFVKARGYEAKFQEQLLADLRVEFQQRRPKTAFGMASRFTRHRLVRGAHARTWGPGQGGPN